MGEFKLESVERALLALELIKGGREFGECITLAKNCRNMEEVERYRVECPICCHTFMMDDVSHQPVLLQPKPVQLIQSEYIPVSASTSKTSASTTQPVLVYNTTSASTNQPVLVKPNQC